MLQLLLAAALMGGSFTSQDTLIQVREGDHLVLSGLSGSVEVEGWSRAELGAEAEGDEDLLFRLSRSGRRIELAVVDRKDRNRAEDLRLFVPRWMSVEVSGRKLDVGVRGLEGEVTIRNLQGDLVLSELSGRVDASSMEGSIDGRSLSGVARLKTGDDDITILDSTADLELETVSGDIDLRGSGARNVRVRTTDGDVHLTGRLLPAGSYEFHSHGGELRLNLEPPVNADVTVLVYEGKFESDFPIRAQGFRSGEDIRFTIGEGGARVLLDAFDGEVVLRRAGAGRMEEATRLSRPAKLEH